ncbi:MAG: NAD-dependent epimerase/dehydratase family protein [Gammaproteobacteria bacterium]|nr:NAD-dependent epimerase/dehydratase family protein [Gammaproteobacteria bacterium]
MTGATGYIGRALVARLLTESQATRVLVRPARGNDIAELWPGQAPHVCIGDVTETASLRAACAGVDTILHLASHSPRKRAPGIDPSAGHWPVTAEGTRALVGEAQRAGVRRFVLVSSVWVMGEGSADGLDESSIPAPTSAYGRAKLAAEEAVRCASDLQSSIVRLPSVYGIGGESLVSQMISAIERGWFPPPPKTLNKRSMIHLDDVVAAVLLLARRPEALGKTYIATDGKLYTTHEIYQNVCAALGRRVPHWAPPVAWLRLAATAGDWLTRCSGRPVPFDSLALEKLVGSAWYRGERMVRDLGFTPRHTLCTALPGMVAFQRESRRGA